MLRFFVDFVLALYAKLVDNLIHKGTIGFHQVVGKWEGIAAMVVEQSQGGSESGNDQSTSGGRAKDGMAIV